MMGRATCREECGAWRPKAAGLNGGAGGDHESLTAGGIQGLELNGTVQVGKLGQLGIPTEGDSSQPGTNTHVSLERHPS